MGDERHTADLRSSAAWCRTLLSILLLSAAAALLLDRLTEAGFLAGEAVEGGAAHQIFFSVPSLFYLAAIWQLRRAAAGIARGDPFGDHVIGATRGVGVLLVSGAGVGLVLPVLIDRLLGANVQRSIDADVATLAIGALGIGQILFAGLMRRAANAERDLSEFF